MKQFIFILFITSFWSCRNKQIPAPEYRHEKYEMPDEKYGFLFREVMMLDQVPPQQFNDAIPNKPVRDIINSYRRAKNDTGFSMKKFLEEHFTLPEEYVSTFIPDESRSITEHIDALWPHLKRQADSTQPEGSPIIPLPSPYFVNEGSATQVRYWDSYFTMLGLLESGDIQAVTDMVDNYAFLVDEHGFVPYGNRSYLASMSNPPFFTCMVELLIPSQGEEILNKYASHIEKEYNYWMKMSDVVTEDNVDSLKVVKAGKYILNRYRDENPWPRTDQYRNDISLASNVDWRPNWQVFRDLRGGAESGWNFTSRWFHRKWRSTIMTSEILPVDLNAILYHMEVTLEKIYSNMGNQEMEVMMQKAAAMRKEAINSLFWDKGKGIYTDYEYGDSTLRDRPSLAMAYPLFFGVATQVQADSVAQYIGKEFMAQGGVVSSTHDTGQRWDYPNGWPHLQWVTVKGLDKYGHKEMAKSIATRWVGLMERVYEDEGKFFEYYNVVELGENDMDDDYTPDGFGPTIGVYLALRSYLEE